MPNLALKRTSNGKAREAHVLIMRLAGRAVFGRLAKR